MNTLNGYSKSTLTDKYVLTASGGHRPINDSEFIVGTQTAATGSWTGATTDTELYDGKLITYWLPFAGSGNASLNLTFPDNTTSGAVPCYYGGTSRLTTHYGAGNTVRLTYRKNVTIGSTTIAAGWWADSNYTDGNTYTSAYCSTAAGTAAKTATCTNYNLTANTYVHLLITYTNTAASALTLNINSKGAKTIYINGVVSSKDNCTLPAGTYLAFYNGSNYYINTDGSIPKYAKVFNKFYSLKQSVTMNTTLTTWYIKIELSGYALPTLFIISGDYNNSTDRAIIETSGMSGGYIFRNVNLNSGNITGLWFKTNYDSTEKRWIFWIRLRAIQDSSTSHYAPNDSATYTVYLGDSIANFLVTATTTEPSGAVWETVGTDATNIFIKNGTISKAINAANATNATNIPVSLHNTNDTNYPLVWSNLNNSNTVTTNQLFKSWQDLYYNPKNKKLTTGTYVAVTGVTTPKVESSATTLIINSGTDLYLKRANDDTKSLVLNSTSFKPFDTANAKLDLGSTSAKWKNIYVNNLLNIVNKSGGTDLGMIVEGSSNKIGFMIGSENVNRGIYDYTNSKWIFYKDGSATYITDWTGIGSSTKPVYFTGGKPVACGSSLAVSITGDADTVDGKHASDFLPITPTQFSQYKKGNWTKILTFTIPVNSITPSISFTWHPTECARYAWGDFNINIRSGAIIFMANWKGNEIRTLKCVGDGTTYNVWVYGIKEGHDPYGSLQVTSTYNITSYQAGSLAYLDADPTGTYTADATKYGAVSSAAKLSVNGGSISKPVYFVNGVPTEITSIDNSLINVTSGTSTLAWNTEITLATIAGQKIKAKLPSNPNSDTKVTQIPTTINGYRPIVLGNLNNNGETTNSVYTTNFILVNPSNGVLQITGSGGLNIKGSEKEGGGYNDPPLIKFMRGTETDNHVDWAIAAGGSGFRIRYKQGTNSWIDIFKTTTGNAYIYKPLSITGGLSLTGALTSTVATGTAPLSIISTTKVNNLNADLLDGYHASSFVQQTDLKNQINELNVCYCSKYSFWSGSSAGTDNINIEHEKGLLATKITKTSNTATFEFSKDVLYARSTDPGTNVSIIEKSVKLTITGQNSEGYYASQGELLIGLF